jgi:hypothetical protein
MSCQPTIQSPDTSLEPLPFSPGELIRMPYLETYQKQSTRSHPRALKRADDGIFSLMLTLMAILFAMIYTQKSFGQDVYNFYFQKGVGPATVIQGGGGQPQAVATPAPIQGPAKPGPTEITDMAASSVASAEAVATPAAPTASSVAVSSTVTPAIEEPAEPFRHWAVALGIAGASGDNSYSSASSSSGSPSQSAGYGSRRRFGHHRSTSQSYDSSGSSSSSDSSSGRFALSVHYYFNKYFNLDGSVASGGDNTNSDNDVIPSIGLTVTPFHISLFGWEALRFGLSAGGIWYKPAMSAGADGLNLSGQGDSFHPYIGGLMALNFTRRLSLELSTKVLQTDPQYGELASTVGAMTLAYRF